MGIMAFFFGDPYNMRLTWKFLDLTALPDGKHLRVRDVRTVGIFKGEQYDSIVKTNGELKQLQSQIREIELTADANYYSDGKKYAVMSIESVNP